MAWLGGTPARVGAFSILMQLTPYHLPNKAPWDPAITFLEDLGLPPTFSEQEQRVTGAAPSDTPAHMSLSLKVLSSWPGNGRARGCSVS